MSISDPTPFQSAVACGDLVAMEDSFTPECLWSQPYNQYTSFFALMIAAENCQLQACKWLIEKGASPFEFDMSGKTALHHACRGGDAEVVSWLIDLGAPLEIVCRDNCTPLLDAARKGKTSAVRVVVEHGANLEVRPPHGYTPLLYAATEVFMDTVSALLDLGADPKAVNAQKEGLLHIMAAEHGRAGAFSSLDKSIDTASRQRMIVELSSRALVLGVCPNLEDQSGRTAMDNAASSGSIELLSMLAAAAGEDLSGSQGNLYAAVAAEQGHLSLLQWLHLQGAKPIISQSRLSSGGLKPSIIAELQSVSLAHATPVVPGLSRNRRI